MIGKAISSVFRQPSPLRNEPTIDYNNTIQSYPVSSYESTIDSRVNKFDKTGFNEVGQNDTTRDHYEKSFMGVGSIRNEFRDTPYDSNRFNSDYDYKIQRTSSMQNGEYNNLFNNMFEEDSDEDLNADLNLILNNITETSDKLTTNTTTLPMDYPGKFNGGSRLYSNSYNKTPASKFSNSIDTQINDLENEIKKERNTKINTRLNQYSNSSPKNINLESLVAKVDQQNRFLQNLDNLIDLNLMEGTPKNSEQKYEALKQDYVNELKNLENFYQAYYKLVFKYRSLKNGIKSKDFLRLKEKVRLIKSTSNQTSIKTICDSLLQELNNHDNSISNYKRELDLANSRIKQLELELDRR